LPATSVKIKAGVIVHTLSNGIFCVVDAILILSFSLNRIIILKSIQDTKKTINIKNTQIKSCKKTVPSKTGVAGS
jgi:hypothetical protein